MPLHTPYVKVQQTRSHTALKSCCSGETLQDAFDHAWELARKTATDARAPLRRSGRHRRPGDRGARDAGSAADRSTRWSLPIGGGGLIAGMASRQRGELAARTSGSSASRRPQSSLDERGAEWASVRLAAAMTIAEGIAVRHGGRADPLARAPGWSMTSCSWMNRSSRRAITLYLNVDKTVAEGAGAAGLAAVLADPAAVIAAVASGWSCPAATSTPICWQLGDRARPACARSGSSACA